MDKYRNVLGFALVCLTLCCFIACEKLPTLESESNEATGLEDEQIANIMDLVDGDALLGYVRQPVDSILFIPDLLVRDDSTGRSCVLTITIESKVNLPLSIPASEVEVIDSLPHINFQSRSGSSSIQFKMDVQSVQKRILRLDYDLTALLDDYYGYAIEPMQTAAGSVLLPEIQHCKDLFNTTITLEPQSYALRPDYSYVVQPYQLQIRKKQYGASYVAKLDRLPELYGWAPNMTTFLMILPPLPDSSFVFSLVELDAVYNQAVCYATELDVSEPDLILRYFPHLDKIMMYWQDEQVRLYPDWYHWESWE